VAPRLAWTQQLESFFLPATPSPPVPWQARGMAAMIIPGAHEMMRLRPAQQISTPTL